MSVRAAPADRTRPLRVLHLIETLAVGGAEVLLAEALPRLATRGIDVRVRALNLPDTLVAQMRRAGVDAAVLARAPSTGKAGLPEPAARLRRELARSPVDLIHTHLFNANLVGRLAALGVRPRPRLVTSLHNPDYRSLGLESVGRWRIRARKVLDWTTAVAANDAFVAVSAAVAEDYRREMGSLGPWKHIDVIHNVIDVDRHVEAAGALDPAAERAAWGFRPGQLAVLSIGRLAYQKNFPLLTETVRTLRNRGVDVQAVVLGDGPDRAALQSQAGDLVRFHGPAPRTAVLSALAACDVYVQSSHYEAFGMAILEAMASARPVVATAVDGVPEVVADGVSGRLVPPGDPAALADAIAAVGLDGGLNRAMGAAGRERARALFSLDAWADRTRDMYLRLCGRSE